MKRVALYMRCSTDQQSVDLQRNDLQSLCQRHSDWNVTEYVDAGISGTKSRRPALDKMMADVRRGKVDTVCVWRFDRLARSVSHLLQSLEEFRSRDVDFVSYSEAIDTSSAIGKMAFTVLGAVAELERNIIIERVRAGQRAAKARGKHIGRASLITDEQKAQIAFLRSQGASLRVIASQVGLSHDTVHRLCAPAQCAISQ